MTDRAADDDERALWEHHQQLQIDTLRILLSRQSTVEDELRRCRDRLLNATRTALAIVRRLKPSVPDADLDQWQQLECILEGADPDCHPQEPMRRSWPARRATSDSLAELEDGASSGDKRPSNEARGQYDDDDDAPEILAPNEDIAFKAKRKADDSIRGSRLSMMMVNGNTPLNDARMKSSCTALNGRQAVIDDVNAESHVSPNNIPSVASNAGNDGRRGSPRDSIQPISSNDWMMRYLDKKERNCIGRSRDRRPTSGPRPSIFERHVRQIAGGR